MKNRERFFAHMNFEAHYAPFTHLFKKVACVKGLDQIYIYIPNFIKIS